MIDCLQNKISAGSSNSLSSVSARLQASKYYVVANLVLDVNEAAWVSTEKVLRCDAKQEKYDRG